MELQRRKKNDSNAKLTSNNSHPGGDLPSVKGLCNETKRNIHAGLAAGIHRL